MKHQLTLKCPWCSKYIVIHNGRLRTHLAGSEKCVGIGVPVDTVTRLNKAIAEQALLAEVSRKKTIQTCMACNGSGYYDHNGSPKCSACGGKGKVRR